MNNESNLTQNQIESLIFTIRGFQVMIDRDLAEMYQVETKVLNQAVKRNIERFPEQFRFQLEDKEKMELVTNCDRFVFMKHSSTNPYAFTEQGVAMLSAVLRSNIAVKVSIQIITTFVEMRKTLAHYGGLIQRIEGLERKQVENDDKFEQVLKALESKDNIPNQGIFFEGQVFDAYEFTSRIIRSAKNRIILVDNYIDERTLTHLAKKENFVEVFLLCKNHNKKLLLDVQKAQEQYGNFELKLFSKSHDRFLIIDNNEIYHLGATLKDLGKKWFAFSKMDKNSVSIILNEILELI